MGAAQAAGVSLENAADRAEVYLGRMDVKAALARRMPVLPMTRGMVMFLARDKLANATDTQAVALLTRFAEWVGLDRQRGDEIRVDWAGVARDVAELTNAGLAPLEAPALDREGIPAPPVSEVAGVRALIEEKEGEGEVGETAASLDAPPAGDETAGVPASGDVAWGADGPRPNPDDDLF